MVDVPPMDAVLARMDAAREVRRELQAMARSRSGRSDRDRMLMLLRERGWTLDELGFVFGVSRERVRQLLQRGRPDD